MEKDGAILASTIGSTGAKVLLCGAASAGLGISIFHFVKHKHDFWDNLLAYAGLAVSGVAFTMACF